MQAEQTGGKRSSDADGEFAQLGIHNISQTFRDLGAEQLIEHAIRRREGLLADGGALVVRTGKFIVRDELTESEVNWGPVNQPFSPQHFDRICSKVMAFLQGSELFLETCAAGAEPEYSL